MQDIQNCEDIKTLQPKLEDMSDEALLALRKEPAENHALNGESAKMSIPAMAAINMAIVTAAVALSKPLAKMAKITDKSFGQYMKHPASLAIIGASPFIGALGQWLNRGDYRNNSALLAIDRILAGRGVAIPGTATDKPVISGQQTLPPSSEINESRHDKTIDAQAERVK
jgi:hypothetical protein